MTATSYAAESGSARAQAAPTDRSDVAPNPAATGAALASKAVEIRDVSKSFKAHQPVLRNVSLAIERGEMVALIGASGSGKSTLIRAIAGLTTIDAAAGSIHILDSPMQMGGRVTASAQAQRAKIGVVFQQFNLVPRLSVLINACLGLLGQMPTWRGVSGHFLHEEKRRAMHALDRVGIASHALKRGSELSGGQQQRAAIARTLVQGAEILIADEPIASLDPSSARRVMEILADLNLNHGITVLVSLHQVEYALGYCPRTIALRDGQVVYDGASSALTPAFLSDLYGAEGESLFLPGLESGTAPVPRARNLAAPLRQGAGAVDDRSAFAAHA